MIDEKKLFSLLEAALEGNHRAIADLRRSCEDGQNYIRDLQLSLKDQENVCTATDLKVGSIDDNIEKIVARLDNIDAWQKVKLPLLVGFITLLITGLGFFLNMREIASYHDQDQKPAVTAPHTHP
jgi:hypothetical protein